MNTCPDEHATHMATRQKESFSSSEPEKCTEWIPDDIILTAKREPQLEMRIDISSQEREIEPVDFIIGARLFQQILITFLLQTGCLGLYSSISSVGYRHSVLPIEEAWLLRIGNSFF